MVKVPVLTVKNAPKKELLEAINYAQKCMDDGAPILSNLFNSSPEDLNKSILDNQKVWGYQAKQKYIAIELSYTPDDFKKMGWDGLLSHAQKLVTSKYENHTYLIGAHNDTKTPHLHIVIDKVNNDTGKLIWNKFNRDQLRSKSDAIAKAMGLSTIKEDKAKNKSVDEDKSLDQKRKSINKLSYIKDMKQKADLSLSIATDYSEYASLLDSFGVKVRIEEKNISYLYPDRKRFTRGKSLGDKYDKKGLTEAFLKNQEKFKKDPVLKTTFLDRFDEKAKDNWQGRSQKSLENFRSLGRRHQSTFNPSEESLKRIDFPLKLINEAKEKSILSYAEDNKIKLKKNKEGETVLKGREHVKVNEHSWINTRNGTRGNVIDFVAIDKNVSYVDAIGVITGNEKVKTLNQHFDLKKLEYKSFHVPKQKRMEQGKAIRAIESFLYSKKSQNKEASRYFFNKGQIQVANNGVLKMLPEDRETAALEFKKDGKGKWQGKAQGKSSSAFYKSTGVSKKLTVFKNPLDFIKHGKSNLHEKDKEKDSTLALLRFDLREIDKFLAANPQVDKISIFSTKEGQKDKDHLAFLFKAKSRYKDYGIDIKSTTTHEKSKSLGRGLEF